MHKIRQSIISNSTCKVEKHDPCKQAIKTLHIIAKRKKKKVKPNKFSGSNTKINNSKRINLRPPPLAGESSA